MVYDVVIIGAGPGGIAAAAKAKELELRYLLVEKGPDLLSGMREFYPKGKRIYPTVPKKESGNYKFYFLKPSDEKITIDGYVAQVKKGVEAMGGLNLKTGEDFIEFKKTDEALVVKTSAGNYETKNLILAIGANIPRELEVYGEAKLVARTLDYPEKYLGKDVLVIGGGGMAADVVVALSKMKRERGDSSIIYWANRGERFKIEAEVARDLGEEILLGGNVRVLQNAKPVLGEVDFGGIRRLTIRIDEYTVSGEIKAYHSLSFPMQNVIACIGFCGPALIFERLNLGLMKQSDKEKSSDRIILYENLQTNVNGVYAIGGAISPSYIRRSLDGKHHEEVPHPNLIYVAVNDGVRAVESIYKKLNGEKVKDEG